MIKAVVIAGPTASGKSALASAVAERFGGAIINADSLQVYRDLRILSARPTAEEEACQPHRLYGYLGGDEPCTAARWAADAACAIREEAALGRLPVIVGGTGLYIKALLDGLSPIPDVPAPSLEAAEAVYRSRGLEGLFADLTADHAVDAAQLERTNRQRMIRAYAVWHATGRSIQSWQREAPITPLPEGRFLSIALTPDRTLLYAACERRFKQMLDSGAAEEVRLLLAKGYPDHLTVMKAVGVSELRECLTGAVTLDQAAATAQQRTRNYAKRQLTWFRHQMHSSHAISFDKFHDPATLHEIMSWVEAFLLKSSDF